MQYRTGRGHERNGYKRCAITGKLKLFFHYENHKHDTDRHEEGRSRNRKDRKTAKENKGKTELMTIKRR
jgi:hypothetical protein